MRNGNNLVTYETPRMRKERLLADVKRHWRNACKHDRMDPKTNFAMFRPNNPHARYYELAMETYLTFAKKENV